MRITNSMLADNFLSDMQVNLTNMKTVQDQMDSGKNFRKPSDDPFNVARAMQMHSAINANTQYNKNIVNTINWLDTTDTSLGQLGNVFQNIRERLISAGNAAYSDDERQKVRDEINERVGQIAQILNTNFDGEYIFGGTKGASRPVNTVIDPTTGNKRMVYSDSNGKEISVDPVVSGDMNIPEWSAKQINFSVSDASGSNAQEFAITLGDFNGKTIDDVVSDINTKIGALESQPATTPATYPLKGKIVAEKTADGKISFKGLTTDNIRIVPDKSGATPTDPKTFSIPALEICNGKVLPSMEANMFNMKRQTEISQGVLMEYNVPITDVLNYTTKDGKEDNIMNLLSRIMNHLDGKDDEGKPSTDSVKSLTNGDLDDIDQAMKQILKVRSEVGAKQNRMDSAKNQNEQANFNMTEILSKVEDVDYTKKTMEYAMMQTIYLASLQTSAKVLQPTLMDYVR